ncbi:MAG: UDP-glucose 4-epimerase GalE [Planctomycetota bacterium]|nr:UDP-glucose 4-epimerase GalE [Planctomycetota bacterium]
MNVLVVGGAGYIGSHMVRILERAGHLPIVLDNLCDGHRDSVSGHKLIVGELADRALLDEVLTENRIDAVMHFAAFAKVGESVVDPAKYYVNNVMATLELLEAMRRHEIRKFVFSSTCATYGEPEQVPIRESEPQKPVNPYGFTKLVIERALDDYAKAYGFGFAALRYFNAAGASPEGDIGEDHDPETHLIPIVLQVALGQRDHVTVFGDDYDTPDGTCIRDYIHVDDLGAAHLTALEKLESGKGIKLNLGTGNGYSVREVIDACRKISGKEIPEVMGQRRAGDPPRLVADSSAAARELGWTPTYQSVEEVVATAWAWHQSHPNGYQD